ncbi:MAG: ATPase [Chloroflexi bacterium HGW-Chloroflexi-7]|nr:MAG: ATPase [Chloroflexi bacterium HGW-Chloroflexi-7]
MAAPILEIVRIIVTKYFLGADLGATKTHILIADENGDVKGFAEGGPGNHEAVGYDGFQANLQSTFKEAIKIAGLTADDLSGSGLGVAGYDWPAEREPILAVINTLNLKGSLELVNDTQLGLLVGSPHGWGVTVVSGTGCNCHGWDATRTRFGKVTGGGISCGEFAGASEMVFMTVRMLSYAGTGRGPATELADAFMKKYNSPTLDDLMQDILTQKIELNPVDARLVFQVAAQGDRVALDLIRWAGHELGELANTVIKQLHFENEDFDLVLIGSMFDGSPLLTEEMQNTVYPFAPKAQFIRAEEPPVVGALLLGMDAAGCKLEGSARLEMIKKLGAGIHSKGKA